MDSKSATKLAYFERSVHKKDISTETNKNFESGVEKGFDLPSCYKRV